ELNVINKCKEEFLQYKEAFDDYSALITKEKQISSQIAALCTEAERIKQLDKTKLEDEKELISIQNSRKSITQRQDSLSYLPIKEKALEELRLTYNQLHKTEKAKQELINFLPDELKDISFKEFKEKYLNKEKALKSLEQDLSKKEALLEFNEKLLPDLLNTVQCPLLKEPCKNLLDKASGNNKEIAVEEIGLENNKQELKAFHEGIIEKTKELTLDAEVLKTLEKIATLNEETGELTLEELAAKGKELKAEVDELQHLKVMVKELPKLEEQITKLSNKLQITEKELNKLLENKKQLPTLENELKSIKEEQVLQKANYEKALVLKAEIDKETTLNELQAQLLMRVDGCFKSLQQTEEKLKEYKDIKINLEQAEKELESLETIFVRWKELKAETDKLSEQEQFLKNKLRQKVEVQKQLEVLEPTLKDSDWFELEESIITDLRTKLNEVSGVLHAYTKILEEKQKQLEELKEKQKYYESQKNSLNNLKLQEEQITTMRGCFKEMSVQMAKYYTSQVGNRATEVFREIMQDASYELEWTEDYSIMMHKHGNELPFETLSGGQQTAAAIAIRLGLLQELSNIRFAFFDEPTAHLDVERRNQLAMQISSVQSFDQLFVITHDESFASQANNVIQLTAPI
ncbi:MAG TPA: hypothetical protein V6C96_02875, partial [Vampirovibrionales bacterium]